VVLEKTLDSPLDSKEIQPVHPKGDQSWVFIGRTDVEAKTKLNNLLKLEFIKIIFHNYKGFILEICGRKT